MYFYATEKQMKQNNQTNNTRTIEVGKFYLIFDGSRTGHPGYIISKSDINNWYLAIRTESDKAGKITKRALKRQHLIDLKHPTDKNVVKSYIRTKPILCNRKDIGKKELVGMRFHDEDMELVKIVSKRKPQKTKSFK